MILNQATQINFMELISFLYYIFIISTLFFTSFFLIIFIEKRKHFGFGKDKVAKNPKSLSVLIPAYNEEDSIAETIKCVAESSYPKNKLEIIVINDGSKDNTLQIIQEMQKKYPKLIKIIDQKNQGKARALNNAIKIAKGEFIAVVDADSLVSKNSLLLLMGAFENEPDISAVTSNIQIKERDTFLRKIQDIEYTIIIWIRKILQFIEAIYVTPGPLSMYKASVLRKVGCFDEKNVTEDIEIAWRLLSKGYKIRIALDALILTHAPTKIKAWWNQRVRWSAGGIQTFLKYRKLVFNKKYGSFGIFVIPFFAFSIFISILGFSIVMYRIFGEIAFKLYYAVLSKLIVYPNATHFITIPNSFTFFGILLLVLALLYLILALISMSNKRHFNIRKAGIFALIVFTLFYVSIFPIVLINSIYRVSRGVWKW